MRWKIIIAASLLAALSGAGLGVGAWWWLSSLSGGSGGSPAYDTLVLLIFPLAAVVTATVFVYRHTSRRRPLQAILTALTALLLTLCALTAASMYIARRTHLTPFPSRRLLNLPDR